MALSRETNKEEAISNIQSISEIFVKVNDNILKIKGLHVENMKLLESVKTKLLPIFTITSFKSLAKMHEIEGFIHFSLAESDKILYYLHRFSLNRESMKQSILDSE